MTCAKNEQVESEPSEETLLAAIAPALKAMNYEGPIEIEMQTASALYNAGKASAILPDVHVLVEALRGLYDLCCQAKPSAFENGVKDYSGTMDEGEYRASEFIDRARAALRAWDGRKTDEGA